MAKHPSVSSRVPGDVAAVAMAVAPGEHRTFAEQVAYWLRLGMNVERSTSVDSRRVLAVVAGEAQFSGLAPDERVAAHARIDAEIAQGVATARFGAQTRRAGYSTVSVDENGNLVEISPGGSRRLR